MPRRITIDPFTRIEGHLKVEVVVEQEKVIDVSLSGTMARGLENLLKGKDPRDATFITERICGVCFAAHGWSSSMAVEMAQGTTILPEAARLLRNLIVSSSWLHDHVLHFYLLSLPDYLDLTSLAEYSGTDVTIRKLRSTLLAAQKSPQVGGSFLGPLMPTYQPDQFCLSDQPEVVAFIQHYFQAIEMQIKAKKMSAMLGGKQPHQSAIIAGGVTQFPIRSVIDSFESMLQEQRVFIDEVYIQDVMTLSKHHLHSLAKSGIGISGKNYLSFGGFPEQDNQFLYPAGALVEGDVLADSRAAIEPFITEDVGKAWYVEGAGGRPPVSEGAFDLDKPGAYSFIKAPRFNGYAMEVGPLARMMVASKMKSHPAYSHPAVVQFREFLQQGFQPGLVMRHIARSLETVMLVDAMQRWIDELRLISPAIPIPIIASPIHDTEHWEPPETGMGIGLSEAPRGSLGHWVDIKNQKIDHYTVIAPTTWNASPLDSNGVVGPLEKALLNSSIPDPDNPFDIARIVRSFDPCIACAVHLITPLGNSRRFELGF